VSTLRRERGRGPSALLKFNTTPSGKEGAYTVIEEKKTKRRGRLDSDWIRGDLGRKGGGGKPSHPQRQKSDQPRVVFNAERTLRQAWKNQKREREN